MPSKKIFLALGLFLVAVAAAFGIYYVFFRVAPVAPPGTPGGPPGAPPTGLPTAGPGEPGTPTPPTPPGALPEIPTIAQGGPTATTTLTERSAKNATLSSDGRTVAYYDEVDNKFYRVGSDGTVTALSNKQFFNVDNVSWAPGARRAILEYPDGANILFDFERDSQVTLPTHWEDFDFSADGEKIISKSIGLNPDNRWLIVANADGSNAKAINPLGDNADKVTVAWSPSSEVVAFSATGNAQGFDTSEIFLIGQNNENFKSLIVEGRDFRPQWSADGNRLLYSVYHSQNGYRPTLWITDARGDEIGSNRRSIGLNTWADKCTFTDATTAYCAVPTSLPEGYGLQPGLAAGIPDQVFRVDVSAGTKSLVGQPAEGSSMTNLSVSADGQYLFYTDARTGLLRQMQLK